MNALAALAAASAVACAAYGQPFLAGFAAWAAVALIVMQVIGRRW